MKEAKSFKKSNVDWITIIAIAAIAISLNVAMHEGIHALACLGAGGNLQEYAALYVECTDHGLAEGKFIAGSAPIFNLVLGLILWLTLRKSKISSNQTWYFVWLLMLMNFLYGSGYFMFSGIANVGDMAVVIAGWEPAWLWRVLMTVVGSGMFMFFVWLALREFGKKVVDGDTDNMRRANYMTMISYATSLIVVVIAGLFNPYGIFSLPVTAGLFAVLGGLSPLLWMMQWFTAKNFNKTALEPLVLERKWSWIISSIFVVFIYAYVLGKTLYF